MSEHNFNRDRNRPYAEDYQDEYYESEYGPRGRSEREFDYGGGYGRHGMNRYGGGGGFGRSGGMGGSRFQRGYGGQRDFDYDYDFDQGNNFPQRYDRWTQGQGGYARQMDRYGQGQGYGHGQGYGYDRGGFGGYERSGYDRSDYGRHGGMGRQQGGRGFGQGQGYGRGFGESGFESGYGRRGMPRHGGYGSDYDMEFSDRDYEFYDMEPEVWSYEEIWLIPGPFTGMGPEGYQRSDERIREDLLERLTQHGQLNARNLRVDVNNCEVTLAGTVESRQAKRMAEDVAESVFGVKDVHNQIRVQERQQGQHGPVSGQPTQQQGQQSGISGRQSGQTAQQQGQQTGQQAGRERPGGEHDRS